ncbi:MAG: hypothetical protein ACJAYG_001102 [Oceanicoccus sp.]|jgi:hypothetical protein
MADYMNSQLKNSALLLGFLDVLFTIPIVTVSYSVHGTELALLATLSALVLIFLGPLPFFFVSSITTDLELTLIVAFSAVIFLAWLKALARGPDHYLPYIPVTIWALMGAYFCVSLLFAHTTA